MEEIQVAPKPKMGDKVVSKRKKKAKAKRRAKRYMKKVVSPLQFLKSLTLCNIDYNEPANLPADVQEEVEKCAIKPLSYIVVKVFNIENDNQTRHLVRLFRNPMNDGDLMMNAVKFEVTSAFDAVEVGTGHMHHDDINRKIYIVESFYVPNAEENEYRSLASFKLEDAVLCKLGRNYSIFYKNYGRSRYNTVEAITAMMIEYKNVGLHNREDEERLKEEERLEDEKRLKGEEIVETKLENLTVGSPVTLKPRSPQSIHNNQQTKFL